MNMGIHILNTLLQFIESTDISSPVRHIIGPGEDFFAQTWKPMQGSLNPGISNMHSYGAFDHARASQSFSSCKGVPIILKGKHVHTIQHLFQMTMSSPSKFTLNIDHTCLSEGPLNTSAVDLQNFQLLLFCKIVTHLCPDEDILDSPKILTSLRKTFSYLAMKQLEDFWLFLKVCTCTRLLAQML